MPVAIISACTQYEMDSGKALGVDAFLAKPFEPVDLVELVRRLMRQGAAGAAAPGDAAAAPGDAEPVVGPTG
ncbi:Response regulatory domain-containing protein OS=Streptomyces antimycoticus OX=68175 GN=SANT12839_064050 PE=4 SV=1 [Streptomyces antimycoticus]